MNQADERIVVLGPGAMGCLFSALLKKGGRDVLLLDHRPERAELIARQGILLERSGTTETIPVPITTDPAQAGPAALVIVCVKAYDTAAAAQTAAALGAGSVLSVQNGVGNVEALVRELGAERVLGGTTAQGANLVGPGHVRHAGVGETVIGQPGGGAGRAAPVAEIFNACGIPARVTDDLESVVWSKVVINAAINALTALLKVKNGVLAQAPAARRLMETAAVEAAEVAAARGVKLLYPDPAAKAVAVAEATAENISSMHADARAKRRTEIEQINGAVAEEARRLGVPAPVNRALADLVRALEESYDRSF